MNESDVAHIYPSDFDVLERLGEIAIGEDLRVYLISEFAQGGRADEIRSFQDEAYGSCRHPSHCENCGICVPYPSESLLSHVWELIRKTSSGSFDPRSGMYVIDKDIPF